jgi:hypothetical protein
MVEPLHQSDRNVFGQS